MRECEPVLHSISLHSHCIIRIFMRKTHTHFFDNFQSSSGARLKRQKDLQKGKTQQQPQQH